MLEEEEEEGHKPSHARHIQALEEEERPLHLQHLLHPQHLQHRHGAHSLNKHRAAKCQESRIHLQPRPTASCGASARYQQHLLVVVRSRSGLRRGGWARMWHAVATAGHALAPAGQPALCLVSEQQI
jgi:hypothetical protein